MATYLHEHESISVPSDAQLNPQSRLQLTALGFDPNSGKQAGARAVLQFGVTRDATSAGGTAGGYRAAHVRILVRFLRAGGPDGYEPSSGRHLARPVAKLVPDGPTLPSLTARSHRQSTEEGGEYNCGAFDA